MPIASVAPGSVDGRSLEKEQSVSNIQESPPLSRKHSDMLNVRQSERNKITKMQTLAMSRSQEKLVQDLTKKLIRDDSVQRIEIDNETNLGGESRSHYPSEVAFD